MPDLDGLEVLRRLRDGGDEVPVCVLSARDEVDDRVARAAGRAPTTTSSSRSRCEEVVARAAGAAAPAPRRRAARRCQAGDLRARPARAQRPPRRARRWTSRAASSSCSSSSCATRARSLDRRRLHEEVWGYTFDPGTNVADVFVGYLRRKLEADGEPRVLHTVRGVGFVLRA